MTFGSLPAKKLLIALLVGIVAALPSAYFYTQYQKAQRKLENPTEFAREETKLLQEKVGKLLELPAGEEPTIATVTDADRLREQPFFANAQNGDRVLIFTNARKAVLYRPSLNKIIEVAPVNLGQNATPAGELRPIPPAQEATIAPLPTPEPTPKKKSE